MTTVDLVPEEFKVSHQQRRRLKLWLVLLACVVLAASVVVAWHYLLCLRQQHATAEQATVLEQTQERIARLRDARDGLDTWKRRLALLNQVQNYGDFVLTLDFLAQTTPDRVYLEQLELGDLSSQKNQGASRSASSESDVLRERAAALFNVVTPPSVNADSAEEPTSETDPIPFTLHGRAITHEDVAHALAIWGRSSLLSGVELQRAQRRYDANGQPYVEFSVHGYLPPRTQAMGVDYAALQTSQDF